jgi:hypothetical protein
MNHAYAIAHTDYASDLSTDALYAFLKAHHKDEAFEGRNGRDRWLDYSTTVRRCYSQNLEKRGFACIPGYESSTGQAVFFDRNLKLIEGERLECTNRRQFLEFDQRVFLASIIISPYGLQTTSLGECVIGVSVVVSRKPTVLVWSNRLGADSESRVTNAINRAVCNSQSTSTFISFLKSKPEDVSVEAFV